MLEGFVDTYKAMEETKIKLSNDHMALVVEMYRNRQSLELRLHEHGKEKGLNILKFNFTWNSEEVDKVMDL